jgi:NAD-specific glutamate dehydrogenase
MLTNEKNLSAEEKIKQLIEFEKDKREELEAKKKELNEKKKELDQLETKREKEIEAARKEIENNIEELATEEKQRFEEVEEIRKKREAETTSLEETIEEEDKRGGRKEVPRQRAYGEIFEQIATGNPTFYDLTNYNVVNRLEAIAGEAGGRVLTDSDKEFIQLVQYHAEKFGKDDFYKNKDESNYLARELAMIDQISKKARDSNIMTREGDYQA